MQIHEKLIFIFFSISNLWTYQLTPQNWCIEMVSGFRFQNKFEISMTLIFQIRSYLFWKMLDANKLSNLKQILEDLNKWTSEFEISILWMVKPKKKSRIHGSNNMPKSKGYKKLLVLQRPHAGSRKVTFISRCFNSKHTRKIGKYFPTL